MPSFSSVRPVFGNEAAPELFVSRMPLDCLLQFFRRHLRLSNLPEEHDDVKWVVALCGVVEQIVYCSTDCCRDRLFPLRHVSPPVCLIRTPGPSPFSGMNSTPPAILENRNRVAVNARPIGQIPG